MKNELTIFYVLLCFCFIGCQAQNSTTNSNSKTLQIFLLLGQSNMAGRAEIEEQDKDTLKNVYLYKGNAEGVWEKAVNPLNKYSTIRKDLSMQKLGPGYTFAKKMAAGLEDHPIGLVVNVKGGTSISEWMPGTYFYDEAVQRTKAAMGKGILKGIIWHQGEANINDTATYMDDLGVLIEALRSDFNKPNLPFIAGQLSEDKAERAVFNKMILKLPKKLFYTEVVTTEDLKTFDKTHFDSESQRILGMRYAEKMLKVMGRQ